MEPAEFFLFIIYLFLCGQLEKKCMTNKSDFLVDLLNQMNKYILKKIPLGINFSDIYLLFVAHGSLLLECLFRFNERGFVCCWKIIYFNVSL